MRERPTVELPTPRAARIISVSQRAGGLPIPSTSIFSKK